MFFVHAPACTARSRGHVSKPRTHYNVFCHYNVFSYNTHMRAGSRTVARRRGAYLPKGLREGTVSKALLSPTLLLIWIKFQGRRVV
jgi:hypothetical protein